MITGSVTAALEAVVRLEVLGADNREYEVRAVIDTGSNGWLTLPAAVIAALRLPLRGQEEATLADGTTSVLDVHQAAILWDGRRRRVQVLAADTAPLLGTALLNGSHLSINFAEGGFVRIERFPAPAHERPLIALRAVRTENPATTNGEPDAGATSAAAPPPAPGRC